MVHDSDEDAFRTSGNRNNIIEKRVEKEIIVDDVEEWPSDVVGKITEITKITEKQQPVQAPVAVNGDARRLMERLNYFLENVESVDARRAHRPEYHGGSSRSGLPPHGRLPSGSSLSTPSARG